MRAIVCGGRDYNNSDRVFEILNRFRITCVIEGGASGADKLAAEWARQKGIEHIQVLADWNRFGNSAGPIRNRKMLEYDPDIVIAFPGGKGTKDMIKQAKSQRVRVIEVEDGH